MTVRERTGDESQPQQSEEDYRAVFELAGIGAAQADPATGRFVRVNPKFCEITGYSAEELLGITFSQITDPEDRREDFGRFQRMVRGEISEYAVEKRYVRKDGSVAWVSEKAKVARNDAAQQPLHAVMEIQDLTERRRAEETLRESEKRSRLLVQGVKDYAIFMLDPNGYVVSWNEGAKGIKGYTAERS